MYRPWFASFRHARKNSELSTDFSSSHCFIVSLQFRSAEECDLEAATFVKLGRHPGLVSYMGTCTNPSEQIILTEYAPHVSLSELLKQRSGNLTFPHRLAMMKQISSAMEAMAEVHIVHRDLASRNVLVFHFEPNNPQRTRVKISDFRLSVGTHGRSYRHVANDTVLPYRWMSPEAIQERHFSEASDMWAMGVTMWEILTGGEMPYADNDDDDHVKQQVCEGTLRLSRPDGCPEGLWFLIKDKCWNVDPKRRPSFRDLSIALENIEGSSLYGAAAERAAAERARSQPQVSSGSFLRQV